MLKKLYTSTMVAAILKKSQRWVSELMHTQRITSIRCPSCKDHLTTESNIEQYLINKKKLRDKKINPATRGINHDT